MSARIAGLRYGFLASLARLMRCAARLLAWARLRLRRRRLRCSRGASTFRVGVVIMESPDLRQLPRNEQWFLGAGVVVFVASFLPWYGVSYNLNFAGVKSSGSASINAWHSYATLGLLLILAATVIAGVMDFARDTLPDTALSWNVVVTGLSAVGALLVVVRSLNLPSASGPGASVGLRWGGWILLIACIVHAVLAVMRMRASGEPMPWAHHGGAAPQPPAA